MICHLVQMDLKVVLTGVDLAPLACHLLTIPRQYPSFDDLIASWRSYVHHRYTICVFFEDPVTKNASIETFGETVDDISYEFFYDPHRSYPFRVPSFKPSGFVLVQGLEDNLIKAGKKMAQFCIDHDLRAVLTSESAMQVYGVNRI